ncbi:exosome complex component RRP4 [Tanacetum coccineum]
MRGGMELMLSLNQTQKIRLQRALESLESGANSNASVTVADTIPVNQEMVGHGTTEIEGEVVATVCGVIERVNKLVYVRTLRARYKPEVGDIIVGRVLEVAQKRWRLEINFSQDATLMLSSMNLPDGIQRRRTAVDELNMRSIFEEDDVICAEVRDFMRDGSLQLQARSQKYGKLEKGQMLTISPYLVKRRKQHFHHLEQYGIDLILGCNGFIWVGEHVETTDNMIEDEPTKPESQDITSMSLEEQEQTYTPLETRQNICRIANAIRVLSTLGFSITIDVILEIVDLSTSKGLDIHDMLGAEFRPTSFISKFPVTRIRPRLMWVKTCLSIFCNDCLHTLKAMKKLRLEDSWTGNTLDPVNDNMGVARVVPSNSEVLYEEVTEIIAKLCLVNCLVSYTSTSSLANPVWKLALSPQSSYEHSRIQQFQYGISSITCQRQACSCQVVTQHIKQIRSRASRLLQRIPIKLLGLLELSSKTNSNP